MTTVDLDEQRERWRAKSKAQYWRDREPYRAKAFDVPHATHCHCGAVIVPPRYEYRPRKYCGRACANQAAGRARDRQLSTPTRRSRRERARQAPGLTEHHRCRLLTRWRQQRRTCAYCPGQPTTVDHVVPLIRGGTNWEGNLAPCCRPCNSSKGDRLLVEWPHRTMSR